LGSSWKIKGVGHCPRVRLPGELAKLAMDGAPGCSEYVSGMCLYGWWFPEQLVGVAAQRLGIDIGSLCGARRRGALIACPVPQKQTNKEAA
jgi:hypothetical protein